MMILKAIILPNITAADLNIHYTSSDQNYSPTKFWLTAPTNYPFIEEYQLF